VARIREKPTPKSKTSRNDLTVFDKQYSFFENNMQTYYSRAFPNIKPMKKCRQRKKISPLAADFGNLSSMKGT
jgi:hypothetical protein